MIIDILKPEIFPENQILCGITKRNLEYFPPFGFSISPAKIINQETALHNRKALSDYLGVGRNLMKFQKQIHSDIIKIVGKDTPSLALYPFEADGMITNEPGVILNITIADCCAILIYDPIMRVIAALHSGWRGTQQNIAGKCISMMLDKFGCQPENLLVYLYPSASGANYEVGKEFFDIFLNSIIIRENKYYFDNKKEIESQLMQCGILKDNIETSQICTIQDLEFHSFRRDKDSSGRMAAFISMII